MDILKGTHCSYEVPTGTVMNLFPTTSASVARATLSTAGVAGGPWTANGLPIIIGPFAQRVEIVVEAISGHVGIDITAPSGNGNGNGGPPVTIADNLTTPSPTSALSANQGTVIKQAIDALVTQFQQLSGGSNPITVANDFPSTPEDTTLTGNVLTNDATTAGTLVVTQFSVSGVPGVSLAGANVAIPGKGSFTVASNGAYTFVPTADWSGTVPTITYQVSNGAGALAQGNLSITVVPVNDAPVASADNSAMMQGDAITINLLANDTDADGDPLTITQIKGAPVVVGVAQAIGNASYLLNADKTVTYTPNPSLTGAQSFTYTVSDGKGGTAIGSVTVTIAPTGTSVTTPVIAFVDVETIPTSGGENNLGGYFRIAGWNLGTQAELGTLTKVYVGGVEVANYRYLLPSVTYAKSGMQELCVQIGAIGGAANGTPLPVTVVRSGTATSNNNVTITPCQGRIFFVSLTGNDATAVIGDITKPYRFIQTSAPAPNYVVNGGVSLVMQPGDHVIIRGGHWTDTAFESAWFRYRLASNQATSLRWHHFTAYPGPVLGNAPEDVYYSTPAGAKGGFHGPGSSYAGTTGDYVSISCLRMDVDANASSDAAPVNMQYAFGPWKVTLCKLGPWPAAINSKAAGVAGHGQGSKIYGNRIFGMGCTGALENHGIYLDSGAKDIDAAWNWIHDITGGNLFQFNDNVGLAGNNYVGFPSGWLGFTGCTVRHNWFENCAKYGLNLAPGVISANLYDNVVIGAAYAGLRTDISYPGGTVAINVAHNTFYNNDQLASGSGNGQFLNSSGSGTFPGGSAMTVQQNIFCAGPKTLAASAPYTNAGSSAPWQLLKQNVWYGPSQTTPWTGTTVTNVDSTGIVGDPKFTNAASGDFTLASGSAALDAATTALPAGITINKDFTSVTPRQQGAQRDCGAFEVVSTLPYPTVNPSFSGTQQVGQSSSVSQGTWGNGPVTLTYQWFTADTLNGPATNVPESDGTTASHAWQLTQQGKYGGCIVTAANSAGSTALRVMVGGTVAASASAPANTTQPAITGTPGVGNVLTRTAGVWTPASGANQAVVTWVWRRAGNVISGTANAATYTQQAADDSAVIDIQETGTNAFGSNTAVSSNTITVPHVSVAPVLVGTASTFDTSAATVQVVRTVNAGDVIALWIGSGNNATYNLTITDDMTGGTSANWLDAASSNVDPNKGGWRYRKMPSSGTVTITIGKDGSAIYSGIAIQVRGVDPSNTLDGAAVQNQATTASRSATPSNTVFAKDLAVAGLSMSPSTFASLSTQSDTLVAQKVADSQSHQVVVQARTLTATGAQSAMTFTQAAGTSGSNYASVEGILVFRGY